MKTYVIRFGGDTSPEIVEAERSDIDSDFLLRLYVGNDRIAMFQHWLGIKEKTA